MMLLLLLLLLLLGEGKMVFRGRRTEKKGDMVTDESSLVGKTQPKSGLKLLNDTIDVDSGRRSGR